MSSGNRRNAAEEAMRFRLKLREVEAQRDELQQQLAAARAQIIQAETDRFTAELIRDDGTIDTGRLRQELAQHLRHTLTQPDTN